MRASDVGTIGRPGLPLTALGFGGAQAGGLYEALSEGEVADALQAAWDAGLRYFDTAPYYGHTLSEHRLGAWLGQRPRNEYVLSTKVGRLMRPDPTVAPGTNGWAQPLPFQQHYDYSYAGVMRSFEDSLQRLGLHRIDMLYVHDIGTVTHGAGHAAHWQALTTGGGFKALDELRDAGVVQAIGLGVNEWEVVHAAMQECRLDCSMLAGRYTLLEQKSLTPFLDDCVKQGHRIVAAGAFNSGILAGHNKFNYGDAPAEVVARVRQLGSVCREFDVPLPAAALQFPAAHPAVVSVVSGVRSADQLRQNVAWFEQALPAEFWQALKQRGLVDERAPLPV